MCALPQILSLFWIPKKSLLKSSHPNKNYTCHIFLPKKKPESKISTLCCLKLASNNSIIFGYVEKCFTGIVTNRYTQSTSFMYLVWFCVGGFEFGSQMWPQILYKEALNTCKLRHFIERRAVKDHSTVFKLLNGTNKAWFRCHAFHVPNLIE